MTKKPIDPARKAEMDGTLAALRRAAKRARETAARTGTPLVLVIDGKVRHVRPQDLPPLDAPDAK